jgi:peptidoglycan/xylan/chitin deacetylase (PgdA/CDA1 family)
VKRICTYPSSYTRLMVHQPWRRRTRRILRSLSRPVHPLLGSIMSVRTVNPFAALTFDDGPDQYHTLRILDVLSRHETKATFFVLAERATRHAQVLTAIRGAGHEIALHGDDHSPLLGRSMLAKFEHIRAGKRRLETMLNEPVRFFRPPYGWQDVRAFLAARSVGLEVVGWTADGQDWLDLSPTEVADRALSGLGQGVILLLHDRCEPLPGLVRCEGENLDRATAVDQVLAGAESCGVRFVALGELLREGQPDRLPWFWRPLEHRVAGP